MVYNVSDRFNSTGLHDFREWVCFLESIERVPRCIVMLRAGANGGGLPPPNIGKFSILHSRIENFFSVLRFSWDFWSDFDGLPPQSWKSDDSPPPKKVGASRQPWSCSNRLDAVYLLGNREGWHRSVFDIIWMMLKWKEWIGIGTCSPFLRQYFFNSVQKDPKITVPI